MFTSVYARAKHHVTTNNLDAASCGGFVNACQDFALEQLTFVLIPDSKSPVLSFPWSLVPWFPALPSTDPPSRSPSCTRAASSAASEPNDPRRGSTAFCWGRRASEAC